MKKFILKLVAFLLFVIVCTEVYIRMNHLTIDIPRREIDKYGIQKYKPLQKGYWSNGTHEWQINERGWPGELPNSLDTMITLIGDSHIENFMNPDSCHLGTILNKSKLKYNFFEAGRSGVNFIESFEISCALQDEFHPNYHFIFAKNSDFTESILELKRMPDIPQFSLVENKIIKGQIKAPMLKLILYNFKTLYYYRNNLILKPNNINTSKEVVTNKETTKVNLQNYDKMFEFINKNYKTQNCVIFLHPDTDEIYLNLLKKYNFKFYKFNTNDSIENEWGNSKNDKAHWSCNGFHEASLQIINYMNSNSKLF
jgi:hypothetical protein